MKKLGWILIITILLGAFFVRLYRFNNPIADWHSWRQVDTSAVSRNFAESGFDVLHPKFDDTSNVPTGGKLDNPLGYRFVEFPVYNLLQAGGYKLSGTFTLEEWGRLVSIFASLLSIIFLFLIVRKHKSSLAGFLAAFYFAFLPFSIYYGRTILPDELMVAASLGGIYFFDLAIDKNKLSIFNFNFILSLFFTAVAFLLKPYALFFTLPMIYLAFEKFRFATFKKWQLWIFVIISILPLALWRWWMLQFPEGIAISDWLYNFGGIRFKGAFFYWLFAERIGKLILGFWGLPLLILGFLTKLKRSDYLFFVSFILASLIYMSVMAKGNVQHDYYQILIIPSICIFLGLGSEALLKSEYANKSVSISVYVACLLFMFSFSWYFVRDYFNVNNWAIIEAGKAVDKLTPKNAKVIANYNGDTSFLYQTKRKGWASFEKPLPEMVKMGADYLVLVNPGKDDLGWGKTYKIVSLGENYVIFNLRQKP